MIFTTDGDMANKILHPRFGLEKVYRVTVDRNFRDADCRRLLEGFFLDDGPVMFSSVERVSEVTVLVSIHEGRNRIVRRSFSTLGYEVKALQRLAIGPILLNKLEPGKFLKLSPRELAQLRKSLSNT
jgi:23S rRNA pseudouridine2605 synthase